VDPHDAGYQVQDIFRRDYRGFDERGELLSALVPTGTLPRALPQLHEHGGDLPATIYAPRKGARRSTRSQNRRGPGRNVEGKERTKVARLLGCGRQPALGAIIHAEGARFAEAEPRRDEG